jgi:hypothetical protein
MLQRDLKGDLGDILMMTIREFLERKLTYEADVLNAFQGVLRDFASLVQSEAVMGTIVRLMDWAILFGVATQERRKDFPSWTWCGWKGIPSWMTDGDLFDWINTESWIIWHYRGLEATSITKVRRDRYIQWGSTSREKAKEISDAEDWNDCQFSVMVQWHIFKYDRKTDATPTDLAIYDEFSTNIARNKGFLQFWSYSLPVTFTCASERHPNKISNPDLIFYDVDGVPCGQIESLDSAVDLKRPKEAYEVIILSEANWSQGVKWSYIDHKERKTVRDLERNIVDGQLNVMLIKWKGMAAERVGIGKVWKETVNYLPDPGLTWKEFILG